MTAAREHITHPDIAYTDARGDITNILSDAGIEIAHVALITCRAGSVRGNHYHPKDAQWMYLLSGEYIAMAKAVNSAYDRENPRTLLSGVADEITSAQTVRAGDLAYCAPGIAHAYMFTKDSQFLNLTPKPRIAGKPEESQVRYELIWEKPESRAVTPPSRSSGEESEETGFQRKRTVLFIETLQEIARSVPLSSTSTIQRLGRVQDEARRVLNMYGLPWEGLITGERNDR